ncbi:MAG: hypothetical protein HY231_20880 [Acidobacteria bacterium]|nr:hypothetical protein [Acidobacteriota bacterium]
MKRIVFTLIFFTGLLTSAAAQEIQVSPSNINAYSQGATSALLTFSNVKNKRPVEGCFCGEVVSAAPDIGLKCNQATQYGCLPVRYNQSTLSANSTYTDIMSIPPSVARRAYVDATRGAPATFYYVRRFVNPAGGADEYVPVTIRLSGNGAAAPFSLTNVKLAFALNKPVLFLKVGEKVPKIEAEITYTGSGRLRGRWEIVKPGDELPSERDLLTESTLPVEQRGSQRRYTQLSRFNSYLPPTGKFILQGPESWRLENPVEGMYLVLLRIEAVEDQNGNSDLQALGAGQELATSGGVAGFSLPVLRYYIGSGGLSAIDATASGLQLLAPLDNAVLQKTPSAVFKWTEISGAAFYRIEIADAQEVPVLSAVLLPGAASYHAPSWLQEKSSDGKFRWRVVALDDKGNTITETTWRNLRMAK